MSNKYQSKKDQFTTKQKSKLPLVLSGVAVVLIAVIAFAFLSGGNDTQDVSYFGDPVVEARSYVGRLVSMTDIEPEIVDGEVRIPLNVVDENDIVYFEIANDQDELVPLMAYITPSGRLFVGSSMCEPCRGRTFSLAGETLVCDACKTTYDVESHEYLSGSVACGSYPPVNMNARVENGIIIFELQEVLSWRIRS